MAKEIIINAEKVQTRIAIVENDELVELYIENSENERTIGDICLGRVRKIMPSIKAAFVDIGQKQDAFLHFSDLSDNLPALLQFVESPQPEVGKIALPEFHRSLRQRRRPGGRRNAKAGRKDQPSAGAADDAEEETKPHLTDARTRSRRRSAQRRGVGKKEDQPKKPSGNGKGHRPHDDVRLENYLKRDQRLLVKIVKEPISSKGSRISTDISLAGRFLVLVPLADYVAVSKKIVSYKERRRLRALAKSLLPDGFGIIVRTVAEGKNAKTLDTDLRLLLERWRRIEKKLAGNPQPPLKVHEDVNMVSSIIRDLFSDDYDRILIDDHKLYRNIKSYVQAVAPHLAPAVHYHKSKHPIFQATKISKSVAQAFESRVELPTGGYLFIERTEAMHVIDVNSGRSGRGLTQEENSLRVNLEAARLIARQIRLRDLGGIIVVDFIDLRDEKNRKKVYDELQKAFKQDRAVTKVLPMSDFGLVQITRQRLRPSITTLADPNGKSSSDVPETAPRENHQPEKETASTPPPEKKTPAPPPKPPAKPDELLKDIEQWIVAFKSQGHRYAVALKVHPFTAAYLNRKVPNYPTRWFMKHLVRIRMELDATLDPLTYRFIDPRSGQDVTEAPPQSLEQP